MAVAHDDTKVLTLDDLLEPFFSSCKPQREWRIGTEAERHAIFADGSAVPFEGTRGISALLEELHRQSGWTYDSEYENGPRISLVHDGASITLEPGGQLELSGAPLFTIHETAREYAEHVSLLQSVAAPLGITYLALGFHPLAKREDLPWVPKLRYPIMRQYLPTRGSLALDMMLRTCTVQSNHDYASEEDAMRKLRLGLRLQPVATAMFANSPFLEGVRTGQRSHRAAVWLDVDADRSGLLPQLWHERSTFRDYVKWALDVPMFLVKRGEHVLSNTGQTFRDFFQHGFQGERATREDWLTHLNTLFPEVRLKKTLEMRGADCIPTELVPALPALWKGILRTSEGLLEAETLAQHWDAEALEKARPDVARLGLRAKLAGRELGEWASDLLAIAERGLVRVGALDSLGRDESIHLAPLRELIDRGQTPADALLARLDPGLPLHGSLLREAAI